MLALTMASYTLSNIVCMVVPDKYPHAMGTLIGWLAQQYYYHLALELEHTVLTEH